MFQVQGSSEPDPLLATLEKYVFASLRELVSIVQNKTIYEYIVVQFVCLSSCLLAVWFPKSHFQLCYDDTKNSSS